MTQSEESKRKEEKRQGDSASARFYRHKDKVLGHRSVKAVSDLLREESGKGLLSMHAGVRTILLALEENENDEEALARGIDLLDRIDAEITRLGQ